MTKLDPRVVKAQQLFGEVQELQQKAAVEAALPKLIEMAHLHEERGLELLHAGDLDGWIDLLAAITAWGKAGSRNETERLLHAGHQFAAAMTEGRNHVEAELTRLEAWLDSLPEASSAGEETNGTGMSQERALRKR